MDDHDSRADQTLMLLRAAAAHLLGLEPERVAKKRQGGKGPPSYRVPVNGDEYPTGFTT
jgi:hypothetical protein